MRAIFVDTSGWMALADGGDPSHDPARAARDRELRGGSLLVSMDCVLDETLTLLRMRLGLQAAARWWDLVERSPRVRWEWIDPQCAERARTWFFRWRDQDLSFTNCTSFVVMRELRIRRALALDRHFRGAGFETLP